MGDPKLDSMVDIRVRVALGEARKIMCQADLLWTSLGTGKESSTYIPSKLFEYIVAKRPILGFFPEGEAAALIRETGTGFIFTSDDCEPVIKAVNAMIPTDLPKNKGKTITIRREEVIASYNIKTITEKLRNCLEELLI